MSYIKTDSATTYPNFLATEVGLVLKTISIPDTLIVADASGFKTVKAGTVWPANDATAVGILFDDVDVTLGAKAASIIKAGRVFGNRLPVAPDPLAVTPLKAQGLYVDAEVETERTIA